LVDLDPQANSTSGIGHDKTGAFSTTYQIIVDNLDPNEAISETKVNNLYIIPSNHDLSAADIELIPMVAREFVLSSALVKIVDRFDFIFLDCPPSLGLISINALAASDRLFIPLQCEYYALEGLGQLLRVFTLVKEKLKPDLEIGGVLLTMADFRTKLTEQVIQEVREYFKEKVFKTVIPRSVKLSEAPSFGTPGIIYDTTSKGSISYILAVEEFTQRFSPSESSEAQKVKGKSDQENLPKETNPKEEILNEKGAR